MPSQRVLRRELREAALSSRSGHERDEIVHGDRRGNHANEVSVTSNVNQADAEATVTIEEHVIVLLMYLVGRSESFNLAEQTHDAVV